MNVCVTKHAEKRIVQRCGVTKKATTRLAQRALDNGLQIRKVGGKLGTWVQHVKSKNMNADNIRLYGDKCYIFDSNVLITVIQIPTEYQKSANARQKKISAA